MFGCKHYKNKFFSKKVSLNVSESIQCVFITVLTRFFVLILLYKSLCLQRSRNVPQFLKTTKFYFDFIYFSYSAAYQKIIHFTICIKTKYINSFLYHDLKCNLYDHIKFYLAQINSDKRKSMQCSVIKQFFFVAFHQLFILERT